MGREGEGGGEVKREMPKLGQTLYDKAIGNRAPRRGEDPKITEVEVVKVGRSLFTCRPAAAGLVAANAPVLVTASAATAASLVSFFMGHLLLVWLFTVWVEHHFFTSGTSDSRP